MEVDSINEKLLSPYLWSNYFVFGPFMLCMCILGFTQWGNIIYICDKRDVSHKVMSGANLFSMMACFIFSLSLTVIVVTYKTVAFYVSSALNRPGGSSVLRKAFYYCVARHTWNNGIHNNENNNENENNDNENRNNNNTNSNNNSNRREIRDEYGLLDLLSDE